MEGYDRDRDGDGGSQILILNKMVKRIEQVSTGKIYI